MGLRAGETFADAVANYIQENAFQPHRGVVAVKAPQSRRVVWVAAFGNDGYTEDERTQRYVRKLKATLGKSKEVEAGLSADGYTWVILVPVAKHENYRVVLNIVDGFLYGHYCKVREIDQNDAEFNFMMKLHRNELIEATGGKPIEIAEWLQRN